MGYGLGFRVEGLVLRLYLAAQVAVADEGAAHQRYEEV